MRDETRLLIKSSGPDIPFASLVTPLHRASTVIFPSAAAFARRYEDFYDGYTYGLFGTPTTRALEDRLSALAGASRTLVVPSGQAALTLLILALLETGDHVLVPDSVYGPVRSFCSGLLKRFGVETTFYDPLLGAGVAGVLQARTRLVLIESPGSNTMEVQDIPAIAAAVHARGITVAADNTWATPLLCKPLELGAHVSIEALSKYIGGHSDVLLGALSTNDEILYRRLKDATRMLGLGASADDCVLVLRGMETLSVRLEKSGRTALEIARWLSRRPEVDRVLHPALPDCPGHTVWKRDFRGASAVFSFLLKPEHRPATNAFIDALKLFRIGASWGGTRSVVAPQDPTAGRTARPWRDGPLIRLSIGLEHRDDLIADLDRAFAAALTGAEAKRQAETSAREQAHANQSR